MKQDKSPKSHADTIKTIGILTCDIHYGRKIRGKCCELCVKEAKESRELELMAAELD